MEEWILQSFSLAVSKSCSLEDMLFQNSVVSLIIRFTVSSLCTHTHTHTHILVSSFKLSLENESVSCSIMSHSLPFHGLPMLLLSRQEYWSGQPFPSSEHLSNSGIKPRSPALQADSLPSEPPGKPNISLNMMLLNVLFYIFVHISSVAYYTTHSPL